MFKGKTVLERVDSETYKLKSSLTFENVWIKVTVKNGLLSNGASIPQAFWSIIGCPMGGKYVGSAIIHDALYGSHVLTREESDKLFIDMMEHNGVGKIKRNLMYWAVRVGGKAAWNATSDEQAKEQEKFITIKRKEA